MIEKYYLTWDRHGTSYRLRPNPDVPEGYNGGAYLGWRNEDQPADQFDKSEIFISPDVLRDISEMFDLAAQDVL